MTKKEEFIAIFKGNVKRRGADELLEYLEETDFFTAPASTKYHGAHEGGLLEHSLNVFNRLLGVCTDEESERIETITIVALLHDLCKANFYAISERNVQKEDGVWAKKPYYTIDDKLPLGHGEKSVFMIMRFMPLTIEEAMCIRWHMGGFDDAAKGGTYALSNAWNKYPLACKLHIADLLASYGDEIRR